MMPGKAYRRALERRRRSLQLRVVATTLVVSAVVVAIVGLLVASQVRDSVLSGKVDDSLAVAAKTLSDFDTDVGKPSTDPLTQQLALYFAVVKANDTAGGKYWVALAGTGGGDTVPRLSPQNIDFPATVGASLQAAVGGKSTERAWQYARIVFVPRTTASESGLIVAQPETAGDSTSASATGGYTLYAIFPLSHEAETLNLVQITLLLVRHRPDPALRRDRLAGHPADHPAGAAHGEDRRDAGRRAAAGTVGRTRHRRAGQARPVVQPDGRQPATPDP